jgi:hypothetical protein
MQDLDELFGEEDAFEDKNDDSAEFSDLFEIWLHQGIIEIDQKFRCPLLLSAEWRKSHLEQRDIPYCKGNANGFTDLDAFFLHVHTKSFQCPYHRILEKYLKEEFEGKISHAIPSGIRIRYPAIGEKPLENQKLILEQGLSMRPKDIHSKIIWPPTVFVSRLEKNLDSKNKILDRFSRFHPVKAAPNYDTHGFSGDCVLVFSANPEGFFNAQRLVNYLNDPIRKKFGRETCGFFATPDHMKRVESNLAMKKVVQGWRINTYAHEVYNPARKILQNMILDEKRK